MFVFLKRSGSGFGSGSGGRCGVFGILLMVVLAGYPGAQEFSSSLEIDDGCEPLTVVTVRDAWPGAEPLRYALVSPGAPVPDGDRFDGVISVPVQRVVALSTTVIPHFRDLGVVDRLVGVDLAEHVYDDEVYRRVGRGDVAAVGSAESLNLERVVAARPDLIVTSAMGRDDPTLVRLASSGIPVVVLADWREVSPLGRAEWIRLFGALFGRRAEADRLFRERVGRYEEISGRVAAVPEGERPSVFANAPWQGTWPVPGGDSYIATLFADGGGRYLWADSPGTGSRFLDLEAVLQRAVNGDFWFNLNFGWVSREDARRLDSRLTVFKAYRTGQMYHYNRRVRPWGANDFWESGAARPDVVLADLVRIMHPELLPDHELVYYRRLE